MRHGRRLAVVTLASLGLIAPCASQAQMSPYNQYNYGVPNYGGGGFGLQPGGQIVIYIVAAVLGLGLGFLFSERMKEIRHWLWLGLGALLIVITLSMPFPQNVIPTAIAAIVLFFAAVSSGRALGNLAAKPSVTFGSAKWATTDSLRARDLLGDQGLALGYLPDRGRPLSVHYTGDRHLLTVAPTRAGKGISAIIPNLLTYRGSALVIDPKGENAMITALRRGGGDQARGIEGLGQKVHVVDPWGLATEMTGFPAACFNPLDWLDPNSPEVGENAMMLADALVVPTGGTKDPFWDEEAKAMLMGFILHVATSPEEAGNRHLGRVRDILMLSPPEFGTLLEEMYNSPHPTVASSAARMAGKEPKLQASVISSAQSHTHFLDSPRLRESLSRSDFRFEDLKREPTTVYLVLPADRLEPFGRWLRLMIQQAITVTARNIADKPERPILFMLDEMAALGRLTMVEQAYSLMAGFGMQLWGIVQDLSQLHRIYGDGWQTFIGNSGVLQYFGSRDKMTAEYFSDLCGMATVPTLTSSISKAFSSGGEGGSGSTSHSYGEAQRKLIMPDELMRVDRTVQLVLVENLDPIAGRKIEWFTDDRFKRQGVNVRDEMARRKVVPIPPPAEERLAAE